MMLSRRTRHDRVEWMGGWHQIQKDCERLYHAYPLGFRLHSTRRGWSLALDPEMKEGRRLVDGERPPTTEDLASWMGPKAHGFWAALSEWIAQRYPGVFTPEWLFYGQKHGWSLRYKKSKAFCTFVPERDRFMVQIVFGADERAKVEELRSDLSAATRRHYGEAKTFHDGKWLLLDVMSEKRLSDVRRLLATKRKPKG